MELVGLLVVVLILLAMCMLYFLPTIIAFLGGSSYVGPIVIVNTFLGWSLISKDASRTSGFALGL